MQQVGSKGKGLSLWHRTRGFQVKLEDALGVGRMS